MKFDTPATTNPIDQMKVVGKPTDRIDGPLKTTGTAPYAYEHHDVVPNAAYGYVVGSAHRQGTHRSMDLTRRKAAPACSQSSRRENAGKLGKGELQHREAARRARRSIITTRRSRWWWPRHLNRRARPRSWCASITTARRAVRPRRREGRALAGEAQTVMRRPRRSRSGEFAARSPQRR